MGYGSFVGLAGYAVQDEVSDQHRGGEDGHGQGNERAGSAEEGGDGAEGLVHACLVGVNGYDLGRVGFACTDD